MPSEEFDVFPFEKVLQSANSINNECLIRRRGHTPQIGREWIQPHQWVDVQFGGIWDPAYTRVLKGNASDNITGFGNGTVFLSDGTNMTVTISNLGGWNVTGTSIA